MIDETKNPQRSTRTRRGGRKALAAKALIGGASAALLFAAGATPAQALTDIAIVSVGDSASVQGSTMYTEYEVNYTLAVVGNFSAHTASSVTLDSIKICSGSLGALETVWVYPTLYTQDGNEVGLPYKKVPSGDCMTWAVGTNYTASAVDGELVRVIAHTTKAFQNWQTVSFTR